MRILAILLGTAMLTLGAPAHASDAPHPPTPPQAHAPHTVHVPSGTPRWVKCPGNPRILMACFTH
jgi:hypothetical protein